MERGSAVRARTAGQRERLVLTSCRIRPVLMVLLRLSSSRPSRRTPHPVGIVRTGGGSSGSIARSSSPSDARSISAGIIQRPCSSAARTIQPCGTVGAVSIRLMVAALPLVGVECVERVRM
jgi:hypothetical protein